MKSILTLLFPQPADKRVPGSKVPYYALLVLVIVGTVRSLIHLFSPDGGAGSIAGLDLSQGGAEIAFSFALWGSSQLIYALLEWVALLRYRSLVPLLWLVQIVEILLRMLVGRLKPVPFAHIPPGQIGNYVILALGVIMLIFSLWSGSRLLQKEI